MNAIQCNFEQQMFNITQRYMLTTKPSALSYFKLSYYINLVNCSQYTTDCLVAFLLDYTTFHSEICGKFNYPSAH